MHNRACQVATLAFCLTVGHVQAQDVLAEVERAKACIDAGDPLLALDTLLAVAEHAKTDTELENVALWLAILGATFQTENHFEPRLLAEQAALQLYLRRYHDRDQAEVAQSQNRLANCLLAMGNPPAAKPLLEAALAMRRRLYPAQDHKHVAQSLNDLAMCLAAMGQLQEALPKQEESLEMMRRMHPGEANENLAGGMNNLGTLLMNLEQFEPARRHLEDALAMRRELSKGAGTFAVAESLSNLAHWRRQNGQMREALVLLEEGLDMMEKLVNGRPDPRLAIIMNNVASVRDWLGQVEQALPLYEKALAMHVALHGNRATDDIATCHFNVGTCLLRLGQLQDALDRCSKGLAIARQVHGTGDHRVTAGALENVASCQRALGRVEAALPQFEAVLGMNRRLHPGGVHTDVASSLNSVGSCLMDLGRPAEALPMFREAVAISARVHGKGPHSVTAAQRANLAVCLETLGHGDEALQGHDAVLDMLRQIHGPREHRDLAMAFARRAMCLSALNRHDEARLDLEQALAMLGKVRGNRPHAGAARVLQAMGDNLMDLDRLEEALVRHQQALEMQLQLHGDRDHPEIASSLNDIATTFGLLKRYKEALPYAERSAAMVEQLRTGSRVIAAELQQSYFDRLKKGGVFERLQRLYHRLDRPLDAFAAAERSRGRQLLDLLEKQSVEPLEDAEKRATRRGDTQAAGRIVTLRQELRALEAEDSELLHKLGKLTASASAPTAEQEQALAVLHARMRELNLQRRQREGESARLLADELPIGHPRTIAQIQAALRADECLLQYTVGDTYILLYVVPPVGGEVVAHWLPGGQKVLARQLEPRLEHLAGAQPDAARGRDPTSKPASTEDGAQSERELFAALLPDAVWQQLKGKKRVFLAPHGTLHRLPFEALVVDRKDGKPVFWLDVGPPIAYVASGSALQWLRQRRAQQADDVTALDLLAVGNPRDEAVAPPVPELGALIALVGDDGEGARIGLRAGDVIIAYDGQPIADREALRDVRTRLVAAIEAGTRPRAPVVVRIWRAGAELDLRAQPGQLSIEVRPGNAREAWGGLQPLEVQQAIQTRKGDLERLGRLPPLGGAEAEVAAVARTFADPTRVRTLVGTAAKEAVVKELAAKARFVHFACHGIAEECAGQSLSLLLLSQPHDLVGEDDGFLKLGDLLRGWRGQLASTQLVVLSACRTNVGPLLRDEAPQALPLGFLFAGSAAVISSLWAVHDASTAELMGDFYRRLAAGETDRLQAFTAARQALRQNAKYADPYYWAPFLYMGSPE